MSQEEGGHPSTSSCRDDNQKQKVTSTLFDHERDDSESRIKQRLWAFKHSKNDADWIAAMSQQCDAYQSRIRASSVPGYVGEEAIRQGVLTPPVDGLSHYDEQHPSSSFRDAMNPDLSRPFPMTDPNFKLSSFSSRKPEFLKDRPLLSPAEEEAYYDSQTYFQSPLAEEPVQALPQRTAVLHHVPLQNICQSCDNRRKQDEEDSFHRDLIKNGCLSVLFQPRSDGATVIFPNDCPMVLQHPTYGPTAFGTKIIGSRSVATVGKLVITITGRKGLLSNFTYGNLTFQLLQTDGQLLCVKYSEILALIRSAAYDPPLLDRAGRNLRIGDAVSMFEFESRIGRIVEFLDGAAYIDVDGAIYGRKFVCLHSSAVYRALMSHLKRRTNPKMDVPVFTKKLTIISDLLEEYGFDHTRLQFCKDLTSGILFAQNNELCYCTRLSLDTAFYMRAGENIQRSTPTRHKQQPITVSIAEHLRHAVTENGRKVSRRHLVLRLSDLKRGVRIICFVESCFYNWVVLRLHHSFDLRPHQMATGDDLILLDDYYETLLTDRDEIREQLDNQVLAGMCPIDRCAFIKAYPKAGPALEEIRRTNRSSSFASRARLSVRLFIDILDVKREVSPMKTGDSRTFVRAPEIEHVLQTTGVPSSTSNLLYAQRAALGETSGVGDYKLGDCEGFSEMFFERLNLCPERDAAEQMAGRFHHKLRDLQHALQFMEETVQTLDVREDVYAEDLPVNETFVTSNTSGVGLDDIREEEHGHGNQTEE